MKWIGIWMVGFFLSFAVFSSEQVHFLSKPLMAGKASLTENGFLIFRNLGTANFSPDLRLPIQLVYHSASEKNGIFGYAWSSPQLESSAIPEKDGVLWHTPWGEKIRFFVSRKTPKDAIKIDLYEQEMKGNRFFAPYSDWNASTSASRDRFSESGNWIFSGKRKYRGWKFIYKDAKLTEIEAPSGRSIQFVSEQGRLKKVTQERQTFLELDYDGDIVQRIRINGVEQQLSYRSGTVAILPKAKVGTLVSASRRQMISLKTGELAPVEFSYDANGYLNSIRQGDFKESLDVQMESLEDRRKNITARADRKSTDSGKVAGRLLSDAFYTYRYNGTEPGRVELINQLKQKASYDFNEKTGVFRLAEFSGKRYAIYYFMRYDVAYLGRIRQIVDGRGRIVAAYRYDKLTGNLIRARDMAENDINYTYDNSGELKLISRRAADQSHAQPVIGIQYNTRGKPGTVSRLSANGSPYSSVKFTYTAQDQVQSADNGQTSVRYTYNKFGYPLSVIDGFGRKTEHSYDSFNRLAALTDPYGVITRLSYDSSGLVVKVVRTDGREILNSLEVGYNRRGQPVSYSDQDGNVKKFERDAFGRVMKEIFPDETSVEYTYNALGQLDTVLDQNRHEIKFGWDQFGLDKKLTAAHQLTDYVYDRFGLLKSQDSRFQGKAKNDRKIEYEYDNLDRVVKVTYDKQQVETYAYDSWGKLIAATKYDGKEKREAKYKYDYFNRLSGKSESVNGGTPVIMLYDYNPWNQRTRRIMVNGPLQLTETRTFDRYGRLIKIKSGKKEVIYEYNRFNQLAKRLIDNVPEYYTYTKYGQLKSKTLGGEPDLLDAK